MDRLSDSFQYVGEGTHAAYMPMGVAAVSYAANGNNLQIMTVLDKQGYEVKLKVTSHTGIRITKKDGNRTTFLLSTMFLKDSVITGKKSAMIGISIDPIHLRDLAKIEFQK